MVALSHATARELGYRHRVKRGQAVRRSVGTKRSRREGRRSPGSADGQGRCGGDRKRNTDLSAGTVAQIAETIAIAAVRYFMVKFSRGKIIVFDIDEALSFEGETWPVPSIRGRPRQQHLQ